MTELAFVTLVFLALVAWLFFTLGNLAIRRDCEVEGELTWGKGKFRFRSAPSRRRRR